MQQRQLDLPSPSVCDAYRLWEYAVMITQGDCPIKFFGPLYLPTAESTVSGFDELKNQWGLSRFSTRGIFRCQTAARACIAIAFSSIR